MVEYVINDNVLVRCTVKEGDTVAYIPEGVTSIDMRVFQVFGAVKYLVVSEIGM